MSLLKNFNPLRFIVVNLALGAFTFLSFLAAFGKDEGTLGDNVFLNFMADAFNVFRFPMHTLFWEYMNGNTFFVGLFINILFYAVFIELIICISMKKKAKTISLK